MNKQTKKPVRKPVPRKRPLPLAMYLARDPEPMLITARPRFSLIAGVF